MTTKTKSYCHFPDMETVRWYDTYYPHNPLPNKHTIERFGRSMEIALPLCVSDNCYTFVIGNKYELEVAGTATRVSSEDPRFVDCPKCKQSWEYIEAQIERS